MLDDDVVLTSAMWVYSEKTGILKYSTLEDYMPLSFRKFSTGWNFFTITPDIAGKTPSDVKGTCNFEKIYGYDPTIRDWVIFPLDEDFYKDIVGVGLVIKATNDCTLGLVEGNGNNVPPPIPN